MLNASRRNLRLRFAIGLAAYAAALVATPIAPAQGTHLWTQSRLEEFEKGTPQGVALGSDGQLRSVAGLREVATTPATFAWSVAVDKKGTAFVGTGSPAMVLRVGPDGKTFTLFETEDLSVQVVRLGPDGALYAATMPSGKVYKLKADATAKQDDSSATVVFDPAKLEVAKAEDAKPEDAKEDANDKGGGKDEKRSHYVWDLTFDSQGRLYVATGGPAAVYRVDTTKVTAAKSGAAPEEFFKSDEMHIRTLAWDAKGNLIAGSDGSGLVYRIDPAGKGYVLFEAPRREITSVAIGGDGTIYAASVGDKSHNPLPPLPVQGNGTVTFTVVQPGSLQVANSSVSAPEGSEIYALAAGRAPRKIWSGKDEVVYALAAQTSGVLALSGNRGRVFEIHGDGGFADIGHLEAQQGLSLAAGKNAAQSDGIFIGTGNTGKLLFLGAADKHEYASDVLDAGALARFGRMEIEPGSAGFEVLTRTGNVEQPVRGWSDWEPLKDGSVASPAGRFLQWKAELHADGKLGSVGVNYLPVNAAPLVDELVVVPGARLTGQNQATSAPTVNIAFPSANQGTVLTFDSGAASSLTANKDKTAITARWSAHDDNGDDLTFALYLRGDGEHVWRLLKEGITDKAYSFDETLIPDGGYQLKVVASDAPSHTPGEALTGMKESDRFEVDTTPPVVSNLKATAEAGICPQGHCVAAALVTFDAEDAMSPIGHAEYSLDAGPWQYIEPVGGLSDAKREHYEIHLAGAGLAGKTGEHLFTVRAYDRYENVGLGKTVFVTSTDGGAK